MHRLELDQAAGRPVIPTLVVHEGRATALEAAAYSREALDRRLDGDAELTVLEITSHASVLGAFQRAVRSEQEERLGPLLPRVRRGSGGTTIAVSPGTLHIVLALRDPAVLVACDPRRVMNRYVRPLLRALTKTGAQAHYFGRDWVSAAHKPIAILGCAHDSETRRTVFEAFVATEDALTPAGESRVSFLGKEPTSLATILGGDVDVAALRQRVIEAYAGLCECVCERVSAPFAGTLSSDSGVMEEPPWTAQVEEVMGTLGAGADGEGVFRFGGDLLASRDAVGRVARRVAGLAEATVDAVGQVVDEELGPTSVLLDGVRDLRNARDVLIRAC